MSEIPLAYMRKDNSHKMVKVLFGKQEFRSKSSLSRYLGVDRSKLEKIIEDGNYYGVEIKEIKKDE